MGFDLTKLNQYIVMNEGNDIAAYEHARAVAGVTQAGIDLVARNQAPLFASEVMAKMPSFSVEPKVVHYRSNIATYTARQAVGHAIQIGASKFVTLTRNTFEAVFSYIPTLLENAGLDEQTVFNRDLDQVIQEMLKAMEIINAPKLDLGKTQYTRQTYPFTFNTTTDTVDVDIPAGTAIKDKNDYIWAAMNQANAYNRADGLGDAVAMVGSTSLIGPEIDAKRFGTYNYQDLSNVYGLMSYASSEIAPAAPAIGRFYTIAPASWGVYTWVSSDARNNRTSSDGESKVVKLPGLPFEVEFFISKKHPNTTAAGIDGVNRAYAETYYISVDFVSCVTHQTTPTTVANGLRSFTINQLV